MCVCVCLPVIKKKGNHVENTDSLVLFNMSQRVYFGHMNFYFHVFQILTPQLTPSNILSKFPLPSLNNVCMGTFKNSREKSSMNCWETLIVEQLLLQTRMTGQISPDVSAPYWGILPSRCQSPNTGDTRNGPINLLFIRLATNLGPNQSWSAWTAFLSLSDSPVYIFSTLK